MSAVHYHLDGYIAHPGISCNHCQDKLKKYLFNVQTTIEVEASNKEEAYEILNIRGGGEVIDRDVLLVEIDGATPIAEDSHLEMEYENRFRVEGEENGT